MRLPRMPSLAVGVLLVVLSASPALAVMPLPRNNGVPKRQDLIAAPLWVTVGTDSVATTVTPMATTVNGVATTISPAPASLTEATTFVLSSSGTATTTTASPPVATASGTVGTYLICDSRQGPFVPMCQPEDGLLLSAEGAYFVTWDTTFFADNPNMAIQIQGNIVSADNSSEGVAGGTQGFEGVRLAAARGFYVWVPAYELQLASSAALAVQLVLAVFSNDSADAAVEMQHLGPTVHLTNASLPGGYGVVPGADDDSSGGGGGGGTNPIAVAVPVAVVVALLVAGLALCCGRAYRRNGRVPVLGRFMGSKAPLASAGGMRASRAINTDAKGAGGIQLVDRESWSPGADGGEQRRNVFRDEIQRQERTAG